METQEGGWRRVTSSHSVQSDQLCRPAVDLNSSVCQHTFIEMDTIAHIPHAIVIGYIAQGVKSFLIQAQMFIIYSSPVVPHPYNLLF